MSINTVDLEFAWGCGVFYRNEPSEEDKAKYILNFDEFIKEKYNNSQELKDAFSVGANNLPFSEVKKG
jgi:hypothetical protein